MFPIFRDVFGVDLWENCMTEHENVFGLTRTQKYDEAQLDVSRRKNNFGIIIVGFE